MANVARKIIGSFEDIGKDIAREVVSVPKDIAGTALESLGSASRKKGQQGQVSSDKPRDARNLESGAFGKIDQISDKKAKAAIARAALQQLAGGVSQPKQPDMWEQKQMEEKQKKESEDAQKAAAAFGKLPVIQGKRRGNLFGLSQKQSSEKGKNARQD